MENHILPLFDELDDFCQAFEPTFKTKLLESGTRQRHRIATLTLSEVLTILAWSSSPPTAPLRISTSKMSASTYTTSFPDWSAIRVSSS